MSSNVPPILPAQPRPIPQPQLQVPSISGIQGMSSEELKNAIGQGGRFVIFQYCISVLILTFKRPSPICFIKPGESAFAKGAPYTLISLLFGWWGIPWGPVWTLTTVANNISGGKDITSQVLAAFRLPGLVTPAPSLSPVAAAEREASKSFIIRFAWTMVALLILLMAWLGFNFHKAYKAAKSLPVTAGQVAFQEANANIGSGKSDSGNTSDASDLALQMSTTLAEARTRYFEKSDDKSLMDRTDQFRTFCDLRKDQCVFLIHVPELRRFSADAQESLGLVAWTAARKLLDATGSNQPGMRLAVGLRGIAAYNRVLVGHYLAVTNATDSPVVYKGFGCERQLYRWFAPRAQDTASEVQAP